MTITIPIQLTGPFTKGNNILENYSEKGKITHLAIFSPYNNYISYNRIIENGEEKIDVVHRSFQISINNEEEETTIAINKMQTLDYEIEDNFTLLCFNQDEGVGTLVTFDLDTGEEGGTTE